MPNDSNRVALIDTEKASIWDIKKHSFVRTIQKWNGVHTSDGLPLHYSLYVYSSYFSHFNLGYTYYA